MMPSIEKLAPRYDRLATAFCIPEHKVQEIECDRPNAWSKLNAVLGEWLRWNIDERLLRDNIKPNKRWLIEAVRTVDKKLGKEIEESKIGISQIYLHCILH